MSSTHRILSVAVLLLLCAAARSEAGWWVWIEELSGPGPFTGNASTLVTYDRIFCKPTIRNAKGTWFYCDVLGWHDDISWYIAASVNELRARPNAAGWPATRLQRGEVVAFGRFTHPRVKLPVDIGFGVGWYRFRAYRDDDADGEAFAKDTKLVFPVRFRVSPGYAVRPDCRWWHWRSLVRAFYIEQGLDYMPGRLDAAEFGNLGAAGVGSEFVSTRRFAFSLSLPHIERRFSVDRNTCNQLISNNER